MRQPTTTMVPIKSKKNAEGSKSLPLFLSAIGDFGIDSKPIIINMKAIVLLAFLFLSFSNEQATTMEGILQCKMHESKFQTINYLTSQSNVFDVTVDPYFFWCKVHSADSKYDSVRISDVTFRRKSIPGFSGSRKNSVWLKFADNKLCKIQVWIDFKPNEYTSCIATYNLISAAFKNRFKLSNSNPYIDGSEQIGEAFTFYNPEALKMQQGADIDEACVIYHIDYETEGAGFDKHKTGAIEGYTIQIEYTNTKGSKVKANYTNNGDCEL